MLGPVTDYSKSGSLLAMMTGSCLWWKVTGRICLCQCRGSDMMVVTAGII